MHQGFSTDKFLNITIKSFLAPIMKQASMSIQAQTFYVSMQYAHKLWSEQKYAVTAQVDAINK
jgi:hypothetical protein